MRFSHHLASLVGRIRLPRPTMRLRLTITYGVAFLLSGAAVLVIANIVARTGTGSASQVNYSHLPPGVSSPPSQAQADIQQLQAQAAYKASQETHSAVSNELLIGSAIALGVMVVLSFGLGWVVAGRALRPVRDMTATARRISADSLHERLAVSGPDDELKDLGDTIDGLLERLESAFSAQRRFVANASHELRTPLTTMRATLDVAVGKPGSIPPQIITLAGRLRSELDRVDRLLEGFLVLARAQHGALPDRARLGLAAAAHAALAARADDIAARDLAVVDEIGHDGALVEGSKALLSRMVDNVIDNAIGHNQPGGWIRVATGSDGATARLVVENGGAVLDEAQVAQLAQPFRRLGADRTGSDKGAGLGLSIVATIASAHGGTLDLRARPGGGLRVSISLPLARAPRLERAGVPA
jgi:signal transduction histidine kinase